MDMICVSEYVQNNIPDEQKTEDLDKNFEMSNLNKEVVSRTIKGTNKLTNNNKKLVKPKKAKNSYSYKLYMCICKCVCIYMYIMCVCIYIYNLYP